MGKAKGWHILVLIGKISELRYDIYQLFLNKIQCITHDDDIRVITHIAGCGSKMYDPCSLGTLEAVGIYMTHDIMPYFLLPLPGIIIVYILYMSLHLGDLFIAYIKSQLLLRLGQCNPEPPPGRKLLILGEDILHLLTCIPLG